MGAAQTRRPSRRFLGYLLFHKGASHGFVQPSGIIGAVIVLLIWTGVGARHTVRH